MTESRWLGLAFVLALALGCESDEKVAEGGSETHFLRTCESDCAGGLVCRCGVCTEDCSGDAQCARLAPNATCVDPRPRVATGRCDAAETVPVCDARCLQDADCADTGGATRCVDGYCRGDVAAPVAPPECTPADIGASELVILGDSLIQLSTFASDLEASALASGELGEGEHYRSYASATMSFLAENSFNIGAQYSLAQEAGAARVIVMNGGATDMLQYPCRDALTPECPAVVAAASGAERLFARMAGDGIEHVVYFFYPDLRDRTLQAGIDVLRPLIRNACGASPVPCHWLDLRPSFAGHDDYLGPDGIVFSSAGARVAAAEVWDSMQARCLPR